MNVCVYCGSRSGTDPAFEEAARAVGLAIAERGWSLIYGGGNIGLMGTVARTALENGATVTGIIPTFLATKEIALADCTELIEVESMHIRKALMIERSDLLVALPGGFGTLDELFEALTWRQIRLRTSPRTTERQKVLRPSCCDDRSNALRRIRAGSPCLPATCFR
ncbi:MAG: TIGR00730 family Rossman fold protein [Ignavibacteria bacterium]|nr:TIGR00730 family Rossman fold protein [Ignavibacteria bacterium]